jgi:DNA-binding response OmpR family regulator
MQPRPARLLCVGNEMDHLETRCAVLIRSGYDAEAAFLPEAETILRTKEFDLVIVSAWLEEWETGQILAAAAKTPALVLTALTPADKLLARAELMLVGASQEK